jgi:hypothetical protein
MLWKGGVSATLTSIQCLPAHDGGLPPKYTDVYSYLCSWAGSARELGIGSPREPISLSPLSILGLHVDAASPAQSRLTFCTPIVILSPHRAVRPTTTSTTCRLLQNPAGSNQWARRKAGCWVWRSNAEFSTAWADGMWEGGWECICG